MQDGSRAVRLCFVRTRVAIGLATVAVSCGGGNTTPTVATPIPVSAPAPELVAQGDGLSVCPGCGRWLYFNLRTAGRVVITVDYTFSDTPMALWLATGHCTYEMSEADQCKWTATSFAGAKPRTLSQSLVAGEFTLVIDNRGPRAETVSFQVVFTPQPGT